MDIIQFNKLKKGDYFTSLNIPDEVGICIVVNKVLSGSVIIINDMTEIIGEGHFLWEKDVKLISRNNDVSKYSFTSQLL